MPLTSQSPQLFQEKQVQQIVNYAIQYLNGSLTGEQYEQLSTEKQKVIAGNAQRIGRLIEQGLTFQNI